MALLKCYVTNYRILVIYRFDTGIDLVHIVPVEKNKLIFIYNLLIGRQIMTTLLLNEQTIPTLAKGWVAGVNNKGRMQEALLEAFEAWIIHKDINARNMLVKLFEALAHNKKATASIRTQFNTLSKRVKKANGDENPLALTVKDGELVDVVPRNKGSNDGGDGGEGSQLVPDLSAPVQPTANGDAIERLREMRKASKCVEDRAALKIAIAAIAASM